MPNPINKFLHIYRLNKYLPKKYPVEGVLFYEKTNFDQAFEETLTFEGGYANITGDTGGETYMGVSRNNFPKWVGWKLIDQYKTKAVVNSSHFKKLLKEDKTLTDLVKKFYKVNFWNKIRLGEINSVKIACELFDTAVNCYWKNAGKCLQEALNLLNRNQSVKFYKDLEVDGWVGSKTLDAVDILIKSGDEISLLKSLNGEQYIYYKKIIKKSPYKEIFFKSWLRRINF